MAAAMSMSIKGEVNWLMNIFVGLILWVCLISFFPYCCSRFSASSFVKPVCDISYIFYSEQRGLPPVSCRTVEHGSLRMEKRLVYLNGESIYRWYLGGFWTDMHGEYEKWCVDLKL